MKRNVDRFFFLFLCSFFSVYASDVGWPFGTVHVVGDSHAPFCFIIEDSIGKFFKKKHVFPADLQGFESFNYVYSYDGKSIEIPFNIYWLGPRTMHRVGRDGLDGLNIKELFHVQENDVIVYVFGEIDVRCHIVRQAYEKNRKYEEIINKLVEDYINTIEENTKYSQTFPVIFSVIPPSNAKTGGKYKPYGSCQERARVTQEVNEKLQRACEEHNILCLNINNRYETRTGFLNPKFVSAAVHIAPVYNDYIKKELVKLILEKLL